MQFHEPGIFNYSALLLSEDKDTLYVGAREAVFALNAHNISKKQHEVWCGLPAPLLSGPQTLSSAFSSHPHTGLPLGCRARSRLWSLLTPVASPTDVLCI